MRRKLMMALVLAAFVLSACSAGVKTLSDAEALAYADEVADISENLLVSLSQGDEVGFTRDMEPIMKEASSGEKFTQIYNGVIGKLGAYVPGSLVMVKVEDADKYRNVVYKADFENEMGVTVRVVFTTLDVTPRVTGLWFDAQLLRQ